MPAKPVALALRAKPVKQFFQGIPKQLVDAARIDGASHFDIYRHVALPLSRPALVACATITFAQYWNDYLRPVLFLHSTENLTVQLGLASFVAIRASPSWELLMAATLISITPPAVAFICAQRFLYSGVVFGRFA